MSNLLSLTSAQLIKAANIKDKIEALSKELNTLLGSTASSKPAAQPAKKGGISAAGRARIAAAAKLRWAKVKAAKPVVTLKPAKKKFVMSAAAKKKISEAAKARWAKIKTAKVQPAAKPVAKAAPAAKAVKAKRVISPAARAKMAAAAKAMWAAKKANKK